MQVNTRQDRLEDIIYSWEIFHYLLLIDGDVKNLMDGSNSNFMLLLDNARKLKIDGVTKQNFEMAAHYRDIEKEIASKMNEYGLLSDELITKHNLQNMINSLR